MLNQLGKLLLKLNHHKEYLMIKKISQELDDYNDSEWYSDDESEEIDEYEEPKSILEQAIEEFGITYSPYVAGYICPDGLMLDFSGGSGNRIHDHREVERFVEGEFEYRSDAMRKFMQETGCIRLGLYGDHILLDSETAPTTQQIRAIHQILKHEPIESASISAPGKDNTVEIEFPTATDVKRILANLKNKIVKFAGQFSG